MPTRFGPQLIGETEKALGAPLRKFLEGTGLAEPQWVTLRLAGALDGTVDAHGLADVVASRAQFLDAADLVRELTSRDLLANGRLTSAGRRLVATVQTTIATVTAPIWTGLSDDDVAAATRVLEVIVARAQAVLRDLPSVPAMPDMKAVDQASGVREPSPPSGNGAARTVIERYLAWVSIGMTSDLADAYAENAIVEQPFLPHGRGRIEGREALRAHFERAASMPVQLRVDNLAVYETTDPEIVVAEYDYRGRVAPTGETFKVSNVQVFRVRDGEIHLSRDYHDHAAIAAALAAAGLAAASSSMHQGSRNGANATGDLA
jgi:ketosteroid isomerase-like protein